MRFDRRRASHERRQSDRVPAVFAVKKAIAGHDGTPSREIQLCQAEDIAPTGITIRRPRGSAALSRAEVALRFALPGSTEQISARGVIVSDGVAGAFRRTGVRFIALGPDHERLIAGYCRKK